MEREHLVSLLLSLKITPVYFDTVSDELILPRPLDWLEYFFLSLHNVDVASLQAPGPRKNFAQRTIATDRSSTGSPVEDADWTPLMPSASAAPPERLATMVLSDPSPPQDGAPAPPASAATTSEARPHPPAAAPQAASPWWHRLGVLAASVGLGGLAVAYWILARRVKAIERATAEDLSNMRSELHGIRNTLAEVRRRTELPAGPPEDTAEYLRRADQELDAIFERIDTEASRRRPPSHRGLPSAR